jgi:hypothetical protein
MRPLEKSLKILLFLPTIYFGGVFKSPLSATQSAIFGILRRSPRNSYVCAGSRSRDVVIAGENDRLCRGE